MDFETFVRIILLFHRLAHLRTQVFIHHHTDKDMRSYIQPPGSSRDTGGEDKLYSTLLLVKAIQNQGWLIYTNICYIQSDVIHVFCTSNKIAKTVSDEMLHHYFPQKGESEYYKLI